MTSAHKMILAGWVLLLAVIVLTTHHNDVASCERQRGPRVVLTGLLSNIAKIEQARIVADHGSERAADRVLLRNVEGEFGLIRPLDCRGLYP